MKKIIPRSKRNPALNFDEFHKLYEEVHAPYVLSNFKQYLSGYRRNYVKQENGRGAPKAGEEFSTDVITEMDFADAETMAAFYKAYTPELQVEFAEREARIFDLDTMRAYMVDGEESDLAG